jgi:hypothetical protein
MKELGLPVGDNNAPQDPYGWQGEPNSDGSNFIPWMVLTAGAASAGTGSFGASASEWRLPYTAFYAGVTRTQLEWLADRVRVKLCNIERENVATDTGAWRIQQIRCTSMGGTNRIGSTFPDYYTQSDLFEVWLSKEI